MSSQHPLHLVEPHRALAWRLAATVALLLVVGSAAGVGIGYVLVMTINLLLSGIV